MPVKRLNFTGRQRIRAEDVTIAITGKGHTASINARLALAHYRLLSDALVRIEAYKGYSTMRFEYGTVENIGPPAGTNTLLTDFTSTDGLLFRVKIAQAGAEARLLAAAEKIRATGQAPPASILPVVPSEDLGQQVWRVDFDEPDGPTLQINAKIQAASSLASDPVFQSLALPPILRQILAAAHREAADAGGADEDSWAKRWLGLASRIGVPHPPNGEEDIEDWLDNAATAFAREHNLLDRYMANTTTDSEEE